jgi:serine/threonine protein kinase
MDEFCSKKFELQGRVSGKFFYKIRRLPFSGASCNLFELSDNCNYYVGKLYDVGISTCAHSIYSRLNDHRYTEQMIDYSIVTLDTKKLYFGIFNKISLNSDHIPGLFDDERAKNLLYEAANHIHKLKIIHNDIKPNNIMCTQNTIVLIDFEYAVDLLNEKSRPATSLIEYSHPKRLLDENFFNERVDFWAIVCSLYEIYHKKTLINTNDLMYDEIVNQLNVHNQDCAKTMYIRELKTFF